MKKGTKRAVAEIKSEARKGAILELKALAREAVEKYLQLSLPEDGVERTREINDAFLLRQYTQTAVHVELAKINWEGGASSYESFDDAITEAQALVDNLLAVWIEGASGGNSTLDRAIRLVAAHLDETEKPVPTAVRDYLAAGPPLKRRKLGNRSRNAFIVRAIGLATKFGLRATSNDEAKAKNSACSLVAEFLGMEEGAVKQVWTRHNLRRNRHRKSR